MTNSRNLLRVLAEIKPTEVYNLAAQSHVQVSFEKPEHTANTDALDTLRLLERVRMVHGRTGPRTRIAEDAGDHHAIEAQRVPDVDFRSDIHLKHGALPVLGRLVINL